MFLSLTRLFAVILTSLPFYVSNYQYPEHVDLVPSWEYISGYVSDGDLPVSQGGGYLSFDSNCTYVAVSALGTMGSNGFDLTSVLFIKIADYQGQTYKSWVPLPYAFSSYTYELNGSTRLKVMETSGFLFNALALPDWTHQSVVYDVASARSNTLVMSNNFYNSQSITNIVFDSDDLLDLLSYPLAHYWAMANPRAYSDGYSAGKAVGKEEGYNQGYAEGRADYASEYQNADMASLFEAFIDFPLMLLSGLSVFSVWNIPIISIIVTFLFLGTIVFIIKRVMK